MSSSPSDGDGRTFGETDIVGKLKGTGHEIVDAFDHKTSDRIDQAMKGADTTEQKIIKDAEGLLREGALWLFFAIAGAGILILLVKGLASAMTTTRKPA